MLNKENLNGTELDNAGVLKNDASSFHELFVGSMDGPDLEADAHQAALFEDDSMVLGDAVEVTVTVADDPELDLKDDELLDSSDYVSDEASEVVNPAMAESMLGLTESDYEAGNSASSSSEPLVDASSDKDLGADDDPMANWSRGEVVRGAPSQQQLAAGHDQRPQQQPNPSAVGAAIAGAVLAAPFTLLGKTLAFGGKAISSAVNHYQSERMNTAFDSSLAAVREATASIRSSGMSDILQIENPADQKTAIDQFVNGEGSALVASLELATDKLRESSQKLVDYKLKGSGEGADLAAQEASIRIARMASEEADVLSKMPSKNHSSMLEKLESISQGIMALLKSMLSGIGSALGYSSSQNDSPRMG